MVRSGTKDHAKKKLHPGANYQLTKGREPNNIAVEVIEMFENWMNTLGIQTRFSKFGLIGLNFNNIKPYIFSNIAFVS